MKGIRSHIFTDFSLETTAREAVQLLYAAPNFPEDIQIKVAFLGNETLEQRLSAIEALSTIGASPMPIISARRLTSIADLDSYLTKAIRVAPITEIFLVGGDPAEPKGPLSDSLSVINSNVLNKFSTTINTIGIAGYPEGHPHVKDEVLWKYLKRKNHELLSRGFSVEITTQLSFNIEAIISWIERVRCEGIDAPIRVGIPSPSTLKGLLKFANQCRVSTSIRLLSQYGWKVTSLLGTVEADNFLTLLNYSVRNKDLGDVRLHVYPMGELISAARWAQCKLPMHIC